MIKNRTYLGSIPMLEEKKLKILGQDEMDSIYSS